MERRLMERKEEMEIDDGEAKVMSLDIRYNVDRCRSMSMRHRRCCVDTDQYINTLFYFALLP